jgi:hypothetical protein
MDNKDALVFLIFKARITQEEAARLIAQETKRPCSVRAVRSWLADPEKPSARPCPEWAVRALEERLNEILPAPNQ